MKRRGFTLIELLIVVAIVALLFVGAIIMAYAFLGISNNNCGGSPCAAGYECVEGECVEK